MKKTIQETVIALATKHGAQPAVMAEYLLQQYLSRKINAQKWVLPHLTNNEIKDIVLR